jgi:hypothetical protein
MSFLLSRQMHIKESQSRMWFTEEMIETQALLDLKAAQQPVPVKEIREAVKTLFLDFPKEDYIISVNVLKKMVPEIYRLPSDTVRTYLRNHLHIKDAVDPLDGVNKTRYVNIPYYTQDEQGNTIIKHHTEKAKAFMFRAKDMLDPGEYAYVHRAIIAQSDAPPK